MIWTIDDIIRATGGRLLYGPPDATFNGVGIDSRSIEKGHLFVAIRGEHHDGHTFIEQVTAKGIRGTIVQSNARGAVDHDRSKSIGVACVEVTDTTQALGQLAAYQRNRMNIPVVAITGSNGKTTTRRMVTHVMKQRYNTLATQGNFNNEIGLPLTLFNLEPSHEMAVLELGMNHSGEIARLGAICRPTIGVITNVGPCHLEFLGSLENIARAKGELIEQIAPDGVVALNRDDPYVAALAGKARLKVVWFGTHAQAHIRAQNIKDGDRGVSFDLVLPDGRTTVALSTPGRFMALNALAAATAGHLAGLSTAEIKNGLEAFTGTKGRLQILQSSRGIRIIDDTYNANPASMAAAIETLTVLRKGQRGIVVVGDMLELGNQAESLHRDLGRQAAESGAGRLYAFGDYAPAVLQGATEAGMAPADAFTGSKEAIVQDLIARLETGDWVLVKGSRGMAMETVVKGIS